jgi:ATPase subunit of ABC transporter with duplicated ATPase domains
MPGGEVILRFNKVSFGYGHNKPIINEADFSVRRGNKITIMGQNGAGKTTLFKLITGELFPEDGSISINERMSVAVAKQAIPRDKLELTIREYFEEAFTEKVYDIEPRIKKITKAINLDAPIDRKVGEFSGGEQARLLLAFAMIQNPDILLLDEPTNNLDKEGIVALRTFLQEYKKTCIVISHDADFLNSFTDGVLYLDASTNKVEQYSGNYFDVVKEIEARIERERMQNVRLERDIENRKEQMGFFSQKGGHLRDVASKMRKEVEKLESEKVEVRQEDKTIRNFAIQIQEEVSGELVNMTSIPVIKGSKPRNKAVKVSLKKGDRLLIKGPNGIGKTTFLKSMVSGKAKGVTFNPDARIGYYRQDFSTLNPEDTVYKSLADSMIKGGEEELRSTAAGFLITKDLIGNKIETLSEGQKGLVSFAKLVLEHPTILILDEPTNHINFRHIPVIAKALDRYEGAMILVSHYPDFVNQIKITQTVDLGEENKEK